MSEKKQIDHGIPNQIMDEWQDASMDVARPVAGNHETSPGTASDVDVLLPSDVLEATGSNELSEGSGESSGMGSFVHVHADDNEYDTTHHVNGDEDSQNTDPSLVLVDDMAEDEVAPVAVAAGSGGTGEYSSLKEETIVHVNEENIDDDFHKDETVQDTPVRSNKVIESRHNELPEKEQAVDNQATVEVDGHILQEPNPEPKNEVVHDISVVHNMEDTASPSKNKDINLSVDDGNESRAESSTSVAVSSPRSQNYRMKHIQLRQKYGSPGKIRTDSQENISLHQTQSNVTSASQVTILHRNTAIPSVYSNISERSDASTFGKDDIGGSLSSDVYLKEWERQKLRKIASEALAGPKAVVAGESQEVMTTLKEEHYSDNRNQSDFDPYAVKEQVSSPAPEMEMNDIVQSSTSKDFLADPRQLRQGNIINTESNSSSNPCVSNPTFENIPHVRSGNGAYIDIGRLIVVGVVGIIGGVIQSVFALTTCQFVTINKKVGYYDEILVVHAGMSSFTPMDSVFQGHSSCISYNHRYYGQQAPVFAKANATLALICGALAVLVLWVYNLTTKTTSTIWNGAKGLAVAATVFQLLSFQFYVSAVCKDETCRIGTGSASSLVAACSYALMVFEMNRNCPVRRVIPDMASALVQKKDMYGNRSSNVSHDQGSFYSAPSLV